MIPRRFRNWLLVWTPVTWFVIALCTYPKDRPVIIDEQIYPPGEVPEASLSSIVGGFFAPTIANYPAWVMVSLRRHRHPVGVLGLVRHSKARMMNVLLLRHGRRLRRLGGRRRRRAGRVAGEKPPRRATAGRSRPSSSCSARSASTSGRAPIRSAPS